MSAATSSDAYASDPENTIYMRLSTGGTVTMELKPDLAPRHVARIKELTREGFYDGIIFHRVIDGFMAQTGDPTGTGMGGSDKPDLDDEFSAPEANGEFSAEKSFKRGAVGMARAGNNTANSQFFICFNDCGFLDGQYTLFAQVTDGMSEVDKVAKGEPPANPDRIEKMMLAADAATPADSAPADSDTTESAPAGSDAAAE